MVVQGESERLHGDLTAETVSDTEEHRALWEPRRGGLCVGAGGKEQMARGSMAV